MILTAILDSQDVSSATNGIFESENKFLNLAKFSGVDVRGQLEVSG